MSFINNDGVIFVAEQNKTANGFCMESLLRKLISKEFFNTTYVIGENSAVIQYDINTTVIVS